MTPFVAPVIEPKAWLSMEPAAWKTTPDPFVLVRVPVLMIAPPDTSEMALPPEIAPALMTDALIPSR